MRKWEIPVRENYVPVYRYSKYRYTGTKNTGRPKLRYEQNLELGVYIGLKRTTRSFIANDDADVIVCEECGDIGHRTGIHVNFSDSLLYRNKIGGLITFSPETFDVFRCVVLLSIT